MAVNRFATVDVVAQLSAMGTAALFALHRLQNGGRDADGTDLQTALDAAGDMPIIGPNCYGFLNYLDGVTLWPDQHGGQTCDSGVAMITQSSNVAINLTMQKRGLPVAYVVTVGNQAQTGLSEVGKALLADPRVTLWSLYRRDRRSCGFADLASFAHRAESQSSR